MEAEPTLSLGSGAVHTLLMIHLLEHTILCATQRQHSGAHDQACPLTLKVVAA